MSNRAGIKATGLVFAAIAAIGASRFTGGGFSPDSFFGRLNENMLLTGAGMFFGFMLGLSVDTVTGNNPGARLKTLSYSGCAAAVVFLVVIHQTRNFISDGPPAIAMGLAFLATSLVARAGKKDSG